MAAGVLVLVQVLPAQPGIAFGAAAVALSLTFALTAPGLLLVAAFPASFALGRIEFGGFDTSVSDAVTAVAVVAAVALVPWHSAALKRVLTALAFYVALLAVTVLANPSGRAAAEVPHRAMLFGGAILIGAAVAHRHQVTAALRTFIAACTVVGVVAIFDSITSGFEPAYAFGLHKNGAGPLLAIGGILLLLVPEQFRLPRHLVLGLDVVVLAGLAATQSRGSGLALVAALAINAVHKTAGRRRRLSVLVLVGALVVIAVSVTTLQDEDSGPNAEFSGVSTRQDLYDYALDEVWAPEPITGGGLKWFADNDAIASGPHNIAVAELSEAGIIGMGGLVVLLGTTLAVLWRRRSRLAHAATVVLVFQVLYAMTSTFWVAGVITLPMLIIGMGIADDRAEAETRAPSRQRLIAGR